MTAKVRKGMITIKKRFIEHGFSFLEKMGFDRATNINYGKPFLICKIEFSFIFVLLIGVK